MRRLESILFAAEVFAVAWPVVFGVRPRRGAAAGILSAALLAQLQFEGFRWQMIPVYLVGLGLAAGDVVFIERRLDWSNRITRGILGTLGLVVTAGVPLVLPVPDLPVPGGPEAIGTITVDLIDRSRDEPYGDRPGGPRELTAQVWYPAHPDARLNRIPWAEEWEVVLPALSEKMGMPSWFLSHTRYTLGWGGSGAASNEGTYPVIIYSHGWSGVRSIGLNQIEELVSNGYIVIAPDHTYLAAATVIDGEEVVPQDPDALPDPDQVEETAYDEAATAMVDTMSADLVTILDALEAGEVGPFAAITGSADLNRIGLYGHSAGGGAAIKTCLADSRCDAVLGLDPWVEPLTEQDLRLNMAIPALYMRSDGWRDTPNDALLAGIAGRGTAVTYWLDVVGADHDDFIMAPLLSPLAEQFGLSGEIPAGRIVPIVDNYLLGFFDVFLLGTGSAALDSVSFPEVDVSVIQR